MKNNKTILIFVNSMKASGGIERVITNLINCWCNNYNVILILKDNLRPFYEIDKRVIIDSIDAEVCLDMEKSKFHRFRSLLLNYIISRFKLKRYLSKRSFEFIYVSNPFNALEICSLGKKIRQKLIISEHGSSVAYNSIYKLIKKIVYPKAYCISVPNSYDTNEYIKRGWNAVYIPHITTYKAVKRNVLNTKIVLNVGRLTSDKQQHLLIEAWNEVKKVYGLNDWKLHIVGDGEEKENLEIIIDKYNLKDSVELIPANNNIEKIYEEASLFTFTSRYEGFGMVLLEAMAFGIPCISFDCFSGPRDIIKDKYNGCLVEPYNVSLFSEKISYFINGEHSILEQYGQNAFNTVKEWNNSELLNRWDKIFEL